MDSLVRLRQRKGLPAFLIQLPAIADVEMAAANEHLNEIASGTLSLPMVMKVLEQLFISSIDEEDAVKTLIPQMMLRKDGFPTKLLPLISNVVSNDGENISLRKKHRVTNKSNEVWGIKEIQSVVETATQKVVPSRNSQHIDPDVILMDYGLDSLGTTELSGALQKYFGISLPSTFVFSNPTTAAMSNHLLELLSPETEDGHSEAVVEPKERPILVDELAIVGMGFSFPGGANNRNILWELLCAGRHSSSHIPFDRWDVSSLTAGSNLSGKEKMQVSHGSFVHDMKFFDPSVFLISKAEAESMSPLQRVLLECSYLTLLDAGYT